MSYVKTTGIVIKEVHTGEADKILTIFTYYYIAKMSKII
ncbi:MAG TPA: recombination protein O N-terminal domain-containing protein, partial [Acetivibrio saccincola]|nr:recombination protein O N-terminal domain-containing protein [Acetivibrio saccincola]